MDIRLEPSRMRNSVGILCCPQLMREVCRAAGAYLIDLMLVNLHGLSQAGGLLQSLTGDVLGLG